MTPTNKREAKKRARSAINKWAFGFASIAWVPGSHYAMTAGDLTMVVQAGSLYAVDIDRAAAASLFTTVAAPLIGSKVAQSILDFIPVVGWAAKSVVAAAVTKGVGESLMHYFEDCSPLPD